MSFGHKCDYLVTVVSGEINEDRMPWYLKFLWVSFNVSGSPSLAVTIMYWALVYDGE